ncbi:MAG: sulfatase-like hydrolase/transferase [Balneolaceae bacterium]|nr:sulfatase-like hydrolase/transferase [Balneolaceae bacterium]
MAFRTKDASATTEGRYEYPGLTTAAQEQDMEIGTTMSWAWDLKVATNPETGEPTDGWDNLVETNRLTDEQLEHIMSAYADDNEYLLDNYDQMTQEELLRWKYQRYIKDYLRVIREVDEEVGRLMAYLERENLLDNTIIIYAGDQGFFLGENGWFDKRWIYEESYANAADCSLAGRH